MIVTSKGIPAVFVADTMAAVSAFEPEALYPPVAVNQAKRKNAGFPTFTKQLSPCIAWHFQPFHNP